MRLPLIGRDRELGSVSGLLEDGSAGGVVVAGPAGVGKTRLAEEVARAAAAGGCAVAWARATRSSAGIPLGAFAGHLPAEGRAGEGAELLSRARHALLDRAEGRRLVLCVDDGQLLDDASAVLVLQAVASGEAFAVVTVRQGEPVPDAVRTLWKDQLCELVELDGLTREEVDRLLHAALGGPVDGHSATAIWDLTRGNALFLRELVSFGLEGGRLRHDAGVWRWRGGLAAGTRLAELVEARLEILTPPERAALEVVAVGAPLESGLLEPAELACVERLEALEVVELRAEARRRTVDVAHPLHGEVVRARLGRARLEGIQRRLADGVEARGARRRGDLLRRAAWRLAAPGSADPDLFERAAVRALSAVDAVLAERYARAAVDAGGGFGARLALGRALAGLGRAEEADAVLGALEAGATSDPERADVAAASARNLFWALHRAEDADAVLRRAEAAVQDDGVREELLAQRMRLASADGRPHDALPVAMALLQDPGARAQARVNAAVASGEALLWSGRITEALEIVEAWLPVAERHTAELPIAGLVLRSQRAFGLRFAGRLVEATQIAEQTYARATTRRSFQNTAVEATALAYVWLARGRSGRALRLAQEAASLLREVDAVGLLPWALAGVAQAAAQAGDAPGAERAVEEMEGRPIGHKGFVSELGLARAWAAAAAGDLAGARAHAFAAADVARAAGQHAITLRVLHETCRFGGARVAAPILAELARTVDGPMASVAAAHAAARAAGDAGALLAAAEDLAGLDALLCAAEAADAAAALHRDAGRAASARTAAARAGVWLQRCEAARPPTLLGPPAAAELTAREREIATLAARGMSSRDIAERLVVSVRTVDNHLQRAYRKLGVARRGDLPEALTGAPGAPAAGE